MLLRCTPIVFTCATHKQLSLVFIKTLVFCTTKKSYSNALHRRCCSSHPSVCHHHHYCMKMNDHHLGLFVTTCACLNRIIPINKMVGESEAAHCWPSSSTLMKWIRGGNSSQLIEQTFNQSIWR